MEEDVCISHSANTFGKDKHSTILSQVKSRVASVTFVWQLDKEKKNSDFKPVKLKKLTLCHILLMQKCW